MIAQNSGTSIQKRGVVWRPTKSEFGFLVARRLVCRKVNNCAECNMSNNCQLLFQKKMANLTKSELDALDKILNSCSAYQGNYCVGCKKVARCSALYDKIIEKIIASLGSHFVYQEFEGRTGIYNPCVEGFEEPIADIFSKHRITVGLL